MRIKPRHCKDTQVLREEENVRDINKGISSLRGLKWLYPKALALDHKIKGSHGITDLIKVII